MKQAVLQADRDTVLAEVTFSPRAGEQREIFERDGNAYYLDRQAGYESNARSYPRRLPIALKRAYGVYVEDVEGRRYFDCLAGAGALALGHHHPVVLEAIQQTLMEGLPFQTLDLTTPVKDCFVEELFATLPKDFADHARIQFCGPSGADAIEAAVKLVKTATGKRSILAFHGAYHGMTHGALGPAQPVLGGGRRPGEIRLNQGRMTEASHKPAVKRQVLNDRIALYPGLGGTV